GQPASDRPGRRPTGRRMGMRWNRRTKPCEKCQAVCRRLAGWQALRGFKEEKPSCPPDDPQALPGPPAALETVPDHPSYIREGGVALHHCGRCDSWWEFWWLSYFNECTLRRVRVPSVARWQQGGRPGRAAFFFGVFLVVLLGSLGTAAVMFLAWLALWML